MQVNKDFIIVVFFTTHPQLQIYRFTPFLILANDATQEEKKNNKKKCISRDSCSASHSPANQTGHTSQFCSFQTVSIAQGTSSRTCFLRCSFRQILGVNLWVLCKAAGPWSCGHVSLREEQVLGGIGVQDTACENRAL